MARLIENKIGAEKYLAIIEQATTPLQNVYTCNVYDYAKKINQFGRAEPIYRQHLSSSEKLRRCMNNSNGWMPNSQSKGKIISNLLPKERKESVCGHRLHQRESELHEINLKYKA